MTAPKFKLIFLTDKYFFNFTWLSVVFLVSIRLISLEVISKCYFLRLPFVVLYFWWQNVKTIYS